MHFHVIKGCIEATMFGQAVTIDVRERSIFPIKFIDFFVMLDLFYYWQNMGQQGIKEKNWMWAVRILFNFVSLQTEECELAGSDSLYFHFEPHRISSQQAFQYSL